MQNSCPIGDHGQRSGFFPFSRLSYKKETAVPITMGHQAVRPRPGGMATMARRKREEEWENHERWLVSYADFITLLFSFFVVMYSISSLNEGKYKVLSDTLFAAFTGQPKMPAPMQEGQPFNSVAATVKLPPLPQPATL
ncbi:MAG: flagellar motor protein MotB, partial [Acidithiobacillus sp.]